VYDFNLFLGTSMSTQGASRDYRGSIWRQLGSPGTILRWMIFQEITKSWKSTFQVFPVTFSTKIWGIDAERFSNHPFISKTTDLPPHRPQGTIPGSPWDQGTPIGTGLPGSRVPWITGFPFHVALKALFLITCSCDHAFAHSSARLAPTCFFC